jgi:small-conductance mechanosensitive channel
MNGDADPLSNFLAAWSSFEWAKSWPQLAAVAACAVLAISARGQLNAWLKRSEGAHDRLRKWPVGLLLLTVTLWIAFAVFDPFEGSAEIVRLAAIIAAAGAVLMFVVRLVGPTPLGALVTIGAIAVAVTEILYLADHVIAVLDAPALTLGGVRLTPWFALKAVVVVGGLFWGAQRVGDLLVLGMANERVLSRSGNVLFGKLTRVALVAAATLFSLAFLGVDVTALAVLSGAVGLGLGFGLQKIVSNYVSGLILLLDKSIKPGDVIELDFGAGRVRGEVTELAGRYTAITLRTGTETLVPNEFLISTAVNNWSHTSNNVQVRLPVGVAYTTDVERAVELCSLAAQRTPRVLAIPTPTCLIAGFGDSSVDLEVRFWIKDSERGVKNVSSDVYLEIWKQFRAHGIEIPFPQRDLHLRSSVAVPFVEIAKAEVGEREDKRPTAPGNSSTAAAIPPDQ